MRAHVGSIEWRKSPKIRSTNSTDHKWLRHPCHVMPIRETASSSDHYRHPLRLPTFWRDHPYIRTTGRKTRRRRFVDVHGVMRTLHARAEKPFACWGGRSSCFGSNKNTNRGTGAMIFVSNLPLKTMQEELLEAINRFQSTSDSRYVCFFPFSLKQLSFLSGLKIRVFHIFERGLCRAN